MTLIALDNVTKVYQLGRTPVHALRGVSLRVEEGQILAVVGPSGSGKSTLLNLIGCLDLPSGGSVAIDGMETGRLSPDQLADLRATSMGYIFQGFNLLPFLTAFENVEYPLLWLDGDQSARRARVEALLDAVGIAHLADRYPQDMSGGERQRTAIARALVHQPRCVLADEPTANLDHTDGLAIIDLVLTMNRQFGTTIVISTHDPKVMARMPLVYHLEDGQLG